MRTPQHPSGPTEVIANPRTRVAWSTALAAALACAVLLPLLGHRSLAMWDEGIYAEISREMLHRTPLVPTWNLQPWLEKPPLMLWITAGFFRVFGVTEFWARAASAFSGVATVVLLHRFLARRFAIFAAWIGTVVLLSTFGFLHVCRAGEMDGPLTLFEFLAVLGLVCVGERDTRGWWLFWIGFAAALMTKGAASLVLPITVAVVALLERWPWRLFAGAFFAGLALFLLLVLPWHLAMLHRFGPVFTHEYLGLHVLSRASSQIEGHYTHPWYYVVVLIASAPPWMLLYPAGISTALRRSEPRPLRCFAVFALVVLVLFTIVKTRLPHYIAPVYPALSLLAAVWLHDKLLRMRAQRLATAKKIGIVALALACWGLAAIATAHLRSGLHSPRLLNGTVTPDTHEPAALLKQALRLRASSPVEGPLLLWAEPPIAPITTAAFYSRRAVVQVEAAAPAIPPKPDIYTWNPVPLEAAVSAEPRLILVEKPLRVQLPASIVFQPIRSSAHWELGTVTRWPQSPAGMAGSTGP